MKVGRPSIYTKELADTICEQLALGRSMRSICREEKMPAMASVFKWLREDNEFSQQYARAKEEGSEAWHEELAELGDEAIDLAQRVDPKSSGAVVQAVKLKADNIKWMMSKMKPKKYGDKMDVTSDNEPIKGNIIVFKDFSGNDATAD